MLDPVLAKILESLVGVAATWILWFIYHRSRERISTDRMAEQRTAYEQLLKLHMEREKEWFTAFKEQTETLQFLVGQLSSIQSVVRNNQFCPIVRKDSGQ